MILATVKEQTLAFVDGRVDSPSGPVPARLGRPVTGVDAVERLEGGVPVHERVSVKLQPGSGAHFRACIAEMGGSIDFDGGDA